MIWAIDKNHQEYKEYAESFGDTEKEPYASIIYAEFKGNYLLRVVWGNKSHLSNDEKISRFELDECERVSHAQLTGRLIAINPEKALDLLQTLH